MFKILLFCGGLGAGIIVAYASDVAPTDEHSANEYLVSKWRQWFKICDAQHKHQLSNEEQWESIARARHLEADNKTIIETIEKLVSECVFYGKPGPILEEKFIDLHNDHFKEDKEGYIAKNRYYFNTLFHTLYFGFEEITEEQFVNGFKGIGHNDDDLLKQFFHLYNIVDGKLSLSDYTDSWVQFTTSEDSSERDIVKIGLDLGI